eukprot:scaffold3.g6231.t1
MLPYVAAGGLGLLWLGRKVTASHQRKQRQREIMQQFEEVFNVPVEQLEQLRDDLVAQMVAGLAGQAGAPALMMLPSFVDVLPTGEETGDCYAIDLGGTNLRVTHVRLSEERGKTVATHMRQWPIPEACFDTDNGRLLPWVAECACEVLAEWHASAAPPVIGFCFSFPMDQTALDNGRIVSWTKNFRGRHLLGSDVVEGLRAAFAAAGREVRVPAILNDAVATLVALRYSEPATQLGIILGTGTNCAYLERVERISKLPGFSGRSPYMAINTEWGDFKSDHLPLLEEDLWIDLSSRNPGSGAFEKLVSGLYLGEVARRLLLRLARDAALFGRAAPQGLQREYGLESRVVAEIDHDETSDLAATGAALSSALGLGATSLGQRRAARRVCELVAVRSARLAAAAVAGVLKHTGACGGPGAPAGQRVVVAVDGSLFAKYPKYKDLLQDALGELCRAEAAATIELQLAQDGSVLGAAVLACAAQH